MIKFAKLQKLFYICGHKAECFFVFLKNEKNLRELTFRIKNLIFAKIIYQDADHLANQRYMPTQGVPSG